MLASALMAAFLWGLARALAPMLETGGWRYLALALLVVLGIAVYGVAGQVIGAFRLSDFRQALRRG